MSEARADIDPNILQREAADASHSVWVSASAGSGKTKVLTDRLLNLLLAGVRPERILCLTYTKAAAAEMSKRLQERLAKWAVLDEETLLEELIALTPSLPAQTQLRKARRLFAEVLDAPDGLKIMTIHAFCQSVLARFPLEAGITVGFEIADDRTAAELLHEAQLAVLSGVEGGEDPILELELRRVAERAADQTFQNLLRQLLGARARLGHLLENPDQLKDIIFDTLGADKNSSDASLIEAACAEGQFDRAGLEACFEALFQGTEKTDVPTAELISSFLRAEGAPDRAAQFDAYQRAFFTKDEKPRAKFATRNAIAALPNIGELMAVEAERLLQVKYARRARSNAERTHAILYIALRVIAAYEQQKHRRALLDYENLILATRDLLERSGMAAWVLYKLDGGIDHLLIDEAQDTSPVQWEIVKKLTEEFFAGFGSERSDDRRTIFTVGDFKQSIYSFQGADPTSFDATNRHFSERIEAVGDELKNVPMAVSFRSAPAILKAVDRVFTMTEAADGVASRDEAGAFLPVEHSAFKKELKGTVEVWPLVTAEEETEQPDLWAPPLERRASADPMTEFSETLAATIRKWWDEGQARPGDVMILLRSRGKVMSEIVRALVAAKVPVAGVDRLALTEQSAVRDLVALGNVLLQRDDDLTLATVLKGPLFSLSEDALFALAHGRGGKTLWQRLVELRADDKAFSECHQGLVELMANTDFLRPHELYQSVLATGGRRRMLERLGPEAGDAIDEFLAQSLAYERENAPSLQGFLRWLESSDFDVKRELESAGNQVRVLTAHGAKGLEAPIVILADSAKQVTQQTDPLVWVKTVSGEDIPVWASAQIDRDPVTASAHQMRADRDRQEYHRLLYVAMTRARERLIICGWRGKQNRSGHWHDLVSQALADVSEVLPHETSPELGERLVFSDAHGASVESMLQEGPAAPDRAVSPPPDWLFRTSEIIEPSPPRPLAPSVPEEQPPALSPLNVGQKDRFKRGLLLHRLFQLLPRLSPAQRRDAGRKLLSSPAHDLAPETVDLWLEEVMTVLETPEFAPVFLPSARAEAPIVGVVQLAEGPRVVSGRIDRLIVEEDRVLIVDFKTNRPAPISVDAVPDTYYRQMAMYRALLMQIYPNRLVSCALLWTDGPRLMHLPEEKLQSWYAGP